MSRSSREFQIEAKTIGTGHPTYFIADIAANHDGDLGRAKELIYLWRSKRVPMLRNSSIFKAESIVSDYGFQRAGRPSVASVVVEESRSLKSTRMPRSI